MLLKIKTEIRTFLKIHFRSLLVSLLLAVFGFACDLSSCELLEESDPELEDPEEEELELPDDEESDVEPDEPLLAD